MINQVEIVQIYIFHTAFLGDLIISLFLVENLKYHFKNAKITYISNEFVKEVFENVNSIDEFIIIDKKNKHKKINDIIQFSKNINNEKKDKLIINLHKSFRSFIFTLFFRSEYKMVFNNSFFSFLFKNNISNNFHESEKDKLLGFIKYLGLETIDLYPKFDFSNLKTEKFEFKNYIMIFPGSVWETKKWNKNYYIEVSKQLSKRYQVLISGSQKEFELCEFIAQESNAKNIAGKYSLLEVFHLVNQSEFIICNDSAPTHIANVLQKKSNTIFGPTDPIFGFYSQNGVSIYNKNLDCRPCHIHGQNICPLQHHNCMNELLPNKVLEVIEKTNLDYKN